MPTPGAPRLKAAPYRTRWPFAARARAITGIRTCSKPSYGASAPPSRARRIASSCATNRWDWEHLADDGRGAQVLRLRGSNTPRSTRCARCQAEHASALPMSSLVVHGSQFTADHVAGNTSRGHDFTQRNLPFCVAPLLLEATLRRSVQARPTPTAAMALAGACRCWRPGNHRALARSTGTRCASRCC